MMLRLSRPLSIDSTRQAKDRKPTDLAFSLRGVVFLSSPTLLCFRSSRLDVALFNGTSLAARLLLPLTAHISIPQVELISAAPSLFPRHIPILNSTLRFLRAGRTEVRRVAFVSLPSSNSHFRNPRRV